RSSSGLPSDQQQIGQRAGADDAELVPSAEDFGVDRRRLAQDLGRPVDRETMDELLGLMALETPEEVRPKAGLDPGIAPPHGAAGRALLPVLELTPCGGRSA